MFFRKKVKPGQGLEVADMRSFSDVRDGSARTIKKGTLALGAHHSWISQPKTAAREGDVFELTTKALLVEKAKDGRSNSFFAGPVYFNAAGEVIKWWAPQTAMKPGERARAIVVRTTAPKGTASVGIGLCGSWAETNPAEFWIGFKTATLEKVSAKR